MGVRDRCKIIAVESGDSLTSYKLRAFIHIEMTLTEVLAQKNLNGVSQRAGAEIGGCGWEGRDVQNRRGGKGS